MAVCVTSKVVPKFNDDREQIFFGVFDGHGVESATTGFPNLALSNAADSRLVALCWVLLTTRLLSSHQQRSDDFCSHGDSGDSCSYFVRDSIEQVCWHAFLSP